MYVHYLHITTLYIHSYTYPPTLSSHMLTLLSPSMSTFISLNSRVVNMTTLALRFVARVVPFVYVPRGTHGFSLPYRVPCHATRLPCTATAEVDEALTSTGSPRTRHRSASASRALAIYARNPQLCSETRRHAAVTRLCWCRPSHLTGGGQ